MWNWTGTSNAHEAGNIGSLGDNLQKVLMNEVVSSASHWSYYRHLGRLAYHDTHLHGSQFKPKVIHRYNLVGNKLSK